jgi:hypothetical protein
LFLDLLEVGAAVLAAIKVILPEEHRQQTDGHLHVTLTANAVSDQGDALFPTRAQPIVMLQNLRGDSLPQFVGFKRAGGDALNSELQILEQEQVIENLLHGEARGTTHAESRKDLLSLCHQRRWVFGLFFTQFQFARSGSFCAVLALHGS